VIGDRLVLGIANSLTFPPPPKKYEGRCHIGAGEYMDATMPQLNISPVPARPLPILPKTQGRTIMSCEKL